MTIVTERYYLDLTPGGYPTRVPVSQGDTGLNINIGVGSWYKSYDFYAPDFPFAVKNCICQAEWQPYSQGIGGIAVSTGWPSSDGVSATTKGPIYCIICPTAITNAHGQMVFHIHGTY